MQARSDETAFPVVHDEGPIDRRKLVEHIASSHNLNFAQASILRAMFGGLLLAYAKDDGKFYGIERRLGWSVKHGWRLHPNTGARLIESGLLVVERDRKMATIYRLADGLVPEQRVTRDAAIPESDSSEERPAHLQPRKTRRRYRRVRSRKMTQ